MEWANLCDVHAMPGVAIELSNGSVVVTAWYAEHDDESGVILLNDWALGDHFGGADGFVNQLKAQGFTNIRSLLTPADVAAATERTTMSSGHWSGPWLTEYPWEASEQAATSEGQSSMQFDENECETPSEGSPDNDSVLPHPEDVEFGDPRLMAFDPNEREDMEDSDRD
jgi:hypothetical protein